MSSRSADEPPKIHRVERIYFPEGHEYFPDWRGTRKMRKRIERAVETRIAHAEPGLCRITGRARVLRPVPCEPLDADVGAFWARSTDGRAVVQYYSNIEPYRPWLSGLLSLKPSPPEPSAGASEDGPIYDSWACGRIAVIDDTGLAIVTGDHVSIFRIGGRAFMTTPFVLSITDGTQVTVVGEAVRAASSEAAKVLGAGYRDAPEALVFEGTDRKPIVLLA